jgi:hypothetical protein
MVGRVGVRLVNSARLNRAGAFLGINGDMCNNAVSDSDLLVTDAAANPAFNFR